MQLMVNGVLKDSKDNLKLKLAYCDSCKLGLGWGVIRPDAPVGHFVSGQLHNNGKLIDIDPSEALAPDESREAFLARMMKKYVK